MDYERFESFRTMLANEPLGFQDWNVRPFNREENARMGKGSYWSECSIDRGLCSKCRKGELSRKGLFSLAAASSPLIPFVAGRLWTSFRSVLRRSSLDGFVHEYSYRSMASRVQVSPLLRVLFLLGTRRD